MNYVSRISIILLLVIGCGENKEEDATNVINYFLKNKIQLENFKQLQIVSRGEDNFIYGIDSLQLGLYLVGFDINNQSTLKISYLPDSLLLLKGIIEKENFKNTILNSAYKNLCIMKRLNIGAVNACSQKENCCIEFKLYNTVVVNYHCSKIENHDSLKKVYGENIKIVGEHWLYSFDENN
jgi:hypothetical protein